MADQPEALRLADALETPTIQAGAFRHEAAAELRRLAGVEAEREALAEANEAFGNRQVWWDNKMLALEAQRDALLEALKGLLFRDEKNTCRHEETHRGGAIWEICDSCGAMWADDKGGKPEWNDPKEWTQAHAAIAKAKGGGNG